MTEPRKPRVEITDADREAIRVYYASHTPDTFCLDDLAKQINRSRSTVCRTARSLGLSNSARKHGANWRKAQADTMVKKWKVVPHPRGFLGGSHSPEARAVMSESSLGAWKKAKATGTGNMSPENRQARGDRTSIRMATAPPESIYSRAKAGRRPDLGETYFRSSWEANYARYLNWLIARGEIDGWEYEPETFWFEAIRRGVRSYKPDFRITEKGSKYFVEVKGWMDPKSQTKMKRMKKYHPTVEVRLVAAKEYRAIQKAVSALIPTWE